MFALTYDESDPSCVYSPKLRDFLNGFDVRNETAFSLCRALCDFLDANSVKPEQEQEQAQEQAQSKRRGRAAAPKTLNDEYADNFKALGKVQKVFDGLVKSLKTTKDPSIKAAYKPSWARDMSSAIDKVSEEYEESMKQLVMKQDG